MWLAVCRSKPNLPYPSKVALALEVACIVDRLHRIGVVHADLKPANILVTDDGSLGLCDFGFAFFKGQPPPAPSPGAAPFVKARGPSSRHMFLSPPMFQGVEAVRTSSVM